MGFTDPFLFGIVNFVVSLFWILSFHQLIYLSKSINFLDHDLNFSIKPLSMLFGMHCNIYYMTEVLPLLEDPYEPYYTEVNKVEILLFMHTHSFRMKPMPSFSHEAYIFNHKVTPHPALSLIYSNPHTCCTLYGGVFCWVDQFSHAKK